MIFIGQINYRTIWVKITIFIALINKCNPISRSDKVCLLQVTAVTLSLCRAHYVIICVIMSSPVWKFFSVAEEDNGIAICNACSARIPRGGKKASSFNTTNRISYLKGRHRGKAVLRDFKQPPHCWNGNGISTSYCIFATSAATSWCSVTVYYRRTAALP